MEQHELIKIVSGGQTGVDRGGLDAAIYLGIEHGGWCPRGRRAEDGRIPEMYRLVEMPQRDYVARTEQNVIDSDGTLILYRDQLTGGTELTYKLSLKHSRPQLCIDLLLLRVDDDADQQAVTLQQARTKVLNFLQTKNIRTLNIAGPRESTSPGIQREAETFLVYVLDNQR
ncbi:MAG: putative molybdenum carrier protein [Planctomycetota bacterium]